MQITTPRGVKDDQRCADIQRVVEEALVRPLDKAKLEEVRTTLLQHEGEACLVEVSAVIGAMDMFTKITQGTGRPPLPKAMTNLMRLVFAIIRFVYELFFRC